MTEQLPYTVVRAFPRFDVRRYPARVLVQTRADSSSVRAGLARARLLRRYLGGENAAGAVIDVTAPLLVEPVGNPDSGGLPDSTGLLDPMETTGQLVSLVVTTGTDPSVLPVPLEESVSLRAVPAHEAAVLRFAGGFSAARLRAGGTDLLTEVRSCRLEPLGGVYYARVDPWWKPGLLGHTEALVRVTSA